MTTEGWLRPDWPAPAGVHAAVSTRDVPGASAEPFARFNLGSRCGDAPAAVAANRAALETMLGLPAPPRWLRQVHGIAVAESGGDGAEQGTGIAVDADEVAVSSGGVKVRAPWGPDVPVILRIEVTGRVRSGHLRARPPRRTFWQWLLRRPRPYQPPAP